MSEASEDSNQLSLQQFEHIELESLPKEILMNRFDRKFICHRNQLPSLLQLLYSHYQLIIAGGAGISPYESHYFDTSDYGFFKAHRRQKGNRTKVRVRKYPLTQTAFIEVKRKNNKGKTDKERDLVDYARPESSPQMKPFLERFLDAASCNDLIYTASVGYKRISLIDFYFRERVSIDTDIAASDQGRNISFGDIAVVEVKTDFIKGSPAIAALRQLAIRQGSFSKYCLSMSLLHPDLKSNVFKPNLHYLQKIDQAHAFV